MFLTSLFVFYRSPASAKSFNATTSAKPSQPPPAAAKHHPHLPGHFSSMRVTFSYPADLWDFQALFNYTKTKNTHNTQIKMIQVVKKNWPKFKTRLISLIKQCQNEVVFANLKGDPVKRL